MNELDDFDRSHALASVVLQGIDGVTVKHINAMSGGMSSDPMALMAFFPPAYSVEAIALEHGVNVMRYGRFGFSESRRLFEFPTELGAPDAVDKLSEVLVPYVREQIEAAAADRASYTGNGPTESRDAMRRTT